MADKRNQSKNIDQIKSQLKKVVTEVKDGVLIYSGRMSISDLAKKLNINANEIIKKFLLQGKAYPLNYVLSEEEIAEVCFDHGIDLKREQEINASNFLNEVKFDDKEEELVSRPPVVTVMGHVDHGKTTLIDKMRKTNVAANEASGITQHTGAYQVVYKGKKITFIDTPGHEAFTQMRSRGAKITDIIILVVAADDGVMPQTKEAIFHAKSSNVPLIVFINKIDRPNKDIEKIKAELAAEDVIVEDYGGDTQVVLGSALQEKGIKELFEKILFLAEVLDLKANRRRFPIGTVIESKLDKGLGAVTTLIVENGTLYKGDFIVAGSKYGRIRALMDSNYKNVVHAHPGAPVLVTGLNYLPLAGDRFVGFKDEKFAKKLANEKRLKDKQTELYEKTQEVEITGKKVINIIIRSDTQGTAEAIKQTIDKKENDDAVIRVISYSGGQVTNSDLLLAQTANAQIFCFNIKPDLSTKQGAKNLGVRISTYNVIYKIIEDVEAILSSNEMPIYEDFKIGEAHVMKLFTYSKVGTIAGCMMDEGIVKSNSKVKVIRNKKVVHVGFNDTLRRGTNDAKEVQKGKDFGLHIKGFNDIKLDDILEFWEERRVN
ncbi:translation initiation factor IF-2 [Mycoplasma elephantis]|uniref:translation initiation factor IF-2 n=1 Tax=Mycoplasma elephantis TaxID=114882 RepID=UPI0004806021|nr:translation initiation factor IF-2 [Mycoplasma elephantis]